MFVQSGSDEQQSVLKNCLLNRLLDSVKLCQSSFGSSSDRVLATEKDARTVAVLRHLESILLHGVKSVGSVGTFDALRIVSERLSSLSTDAGDAIATEAWKYIRLHLSDSERRRFEDPQSESFLRSISTDSGRFRSFLRDALNEKKLGRCLSEVIADPTNSIANHYESWAFLRDPELNATLPQISSGLGAIHFAIDLNNPALNCMPDLREDTSALLLEARPASQPIVAVNKITETAKRTKNRKPLVNFVSFESDQSEAPKMKVVSSSSRESRDEVLRVWDKKQSESVTSNNAEHNIIMSEATPASVAIRSEAANAPNSANQDNDEEDNESVYSSVFEDRANTISPPGGDLECPNTGLLVSLINYNPSTSSILSPEEVKSASDESLPEDQPTSDFATELTSSDILSLQNNHTMHNNDTDMVTRLKEQADLIQALRAELQAQGKRNTEGIQSMERRLDSANRENEALKTQVRSYTSAIRLLKETDSRQTSRANSVSGTEEADYERKLVALAQMHAELLELHSQTQTDYALQCRINTRLRNELVQLRGPLDIGEANEFLLGSDDSTRSVLNLWIPTTFMTGRGTDVHHVYQIYVRLRDAEWNVYRRYSEALLLHRALRKRAKKETAALRFPPKKNVGRKDKDFVEQRRKLLESYLRQALNYALLNLAEFSNVECVSKELLVNVIPFLNDLLHSMSSKVMLRS